MLADTVFTAPLSIVAAVAGCLLIAGMLKGIIGVGMAARRNVWLASPPS